MRVLEKGENYELITTGAYQSIDISNMAVERVLGKKARPEPYVL